jgi:HEPN domain-containing protein
MKKPREEAQRWLRQALEDMATARALFDAKRYYMVCFVCQQIAEKALKAYLLAQGEPPALTHGVDELCRLAAEHDAAFSALRSRISILDGYYVPTRYPDSLPSGIPADVYNAAAAEQTLRLAQDALDFVQARLENP